MKELIVVMPVYNEEGAIGGVLKKWSNALAALGIDYGIFAYNDGSKDNTSAILKAAAAENPRIKAVDKPNSGHGPTILRGYREACEEAEWVFQIDSDDEMGPESFPVLWNRRADHDFLLGRREGRASPLPRKIISAVSRMTVRMLYGPGIWDVNSPYRLMRADQFKGVFRQIPDDTFAPNVIISGYACHRRLRLCELPVAHQERTTGTVSIKKWKLLKAAARSFWQSASFAFRR